MSLRIFRAGLKYSVVDAKWPAFEEAFLGFSPPRVRAMSEETVEGLMKDQRLIRHFGKLRATHANGAAFCAVAAEFGGFGRYLADWPGDDIVGLWDDLAKRFRQMGGNSGPMFLRMAGKDTFTLSESVVKGMIRWGALDAAPKGKGDRKKVQAQFNAWAASTGKKLCQLIMTLAQSVD
jgi:3-methyladenine DNA glycosylase Tag